MLTQGKLHNPGGVIRTGAGKTKLAVGVLDNTGRGVIQVDGDLRLLVAELSNTEGRIAVQGRAQIECRDKLSNGGAQLRAERGLALSVGSEADNACGSIESGGDLQFALRGILSNAGGRLSAAQGELRLQALTGTVVNDAGDIGAGHALRIDAAALSNGKKSRLMAEDISLHVGELDNAGGRIVAQRALRIAASALDNGDGGRLVAGDSAELDLERHLRNGGGRIHVHGDTLVMRVPLGEIDNRDGEFRLPLAQSSWVAKAVHGELPAARP
jgi:filamentous hemagglutinin